MNVKSIKPTVEVDFSDGNIVKVWLTATVNDGKRDNYVSTDTYMFRDSRTDPIEIRNAVRREVITGIAEKDPREADEWLASYAESKRSTS